MNDSIKEMYGKIQMPQHCENTIRQALSQKPAKNMRRFRPAAAAALAAAVLLVAFASSGNVVRAVGEAAQRVVIHFFGDVFVDAVDAYQTNTEATEDSLQDYVEVVEGRIYLRTQDASIDITDRISMETPYIHIYTDGKGMERALVVGGTPENMGYMEFHKGLLADGTLGWKDGASQNHCDRNGARYPWVDAAWEILGLPWLPPGDTE